MALPIVPIDKERAKAKQLQRVTMEELSSASWIRKEAEIFQQNQALEFRGKKTLKKLQMLSAGFPQQLSLASVCMVNSSRSANMYEFYL